MGPEPLIVAPAYNEAKNLPAFLAAIVPVLDGSASRARSSSSTTAAATARSACSPRRASQDPRIKVVGLARNFGKDIALSAGLAHARGHAVIPIDCDLQHPPELIPQIVAKWRAGSDMVIGVRTKRNEEGLLRRTLVAHVLRSCADDERRDPAERRRLPPARSQDRRRHQPDARAPPVHEGHLRVARLQDRVDRVPGQRARTARQHAGASSSCGGSRSTACSRSRPRRSRSGRTSAGCRRSPRSSTS